MEKAVFDFIRELLASDGIPYHCAALPCQEWEWFDLGLRSRILGIENLSQKLNRNFEALEENTMYHYMDFFHCFYTILQLPEEAALYFHSPTALEPREMDSLSPGRHLLVVGPVLFEAFHGKRFEALFHELDLPPRLMEPLRSHYQNIPVIPSPPHFENMMTVIANFIYNRMPYQIVFNSQGDLENLRLQYGGIARVPEQPFLNLQYIENRYEAENQLVTAVSRGNEAQAMEGIRKLVSSGMPPRLDNSLRDKKDITITLNTLMRKAVELAGVHPIHIDSFSNQSIQQIEQLGSIEQCLDFQRKLVLGYCRLVKKYSLTGYSFPVQKVITYITTDLSADLGLKALAGRLNVTPSYLSALFRKEMGMTLTDYVNQQRISHAQHLLINTNLPIKFIAQQCGIADLNYFVRIFKRTAGVTPKVYRDTMSHSPQMELFRGHSAKSGCASGK